IGCHAGLCDAGPSSWSDPSRESHRNTRPAGTAQGAAAAFPTLEAGLFFNRRKGVTSRRASGYIWGTSGTYPGSSCVSPADPYRLCSSDLTALPGTARNVLDRLAMQKVVGSNPISRLPLSRMNKGFVPFPLCCERRPPWPSGYIGVHFDPL